MESGEAYEFDPASFFEAMVEQDSDSLSFAVRRTVPEKGRTLSAEAVDQLTEVFRTVLGARLSASLRRRGPDGPGHGEVGIELNVRIDGVSVGVSDDLHPWYAMVDGEHRGVH